MRESRGSPNELLCPTDRPNRLRRRPDPAPVPTPNRDGTHPPNSEDSPPTEGQPLGYDDTTFPRAATGRSLLASSRSGTARTPRRQILIVGDGVTGLALALFLQEIGHEPLLVYTDADHPVSAVSTVAPSALTLFDRVGLGDAVRDNGHRLDGVTVQSNDESPDHVLTANDQTPYLIANSRFRELLRSHIESGATPVSMAIETLTRRDNSVEVTFDTGVREQFDVVVGTDGPASSVRSAAGTESTPWATWAQWEVIRHDIPTQAHPVLERWAEPYVAQLFTGLTDEVGDVLRITDARPDTGEPTAPEPIGAELLASGGVEADTVDTDDWNRYTVSQSTWDAGHWTGDGVAYCGPSALPMAPATGVETMFGIEDAYVLADELSTPTQSIGEALGQYRQRRRTRIQVIANRAAASHDHRPCPTVDGALGPTSEGRAVALGSVCGERLAELHHAVPNRL